MEADPKYIINTIQGIINSYNIKHDIKIVETEVAGPNYQIDCKYTIEGKVGVKFKELYSKLKDDLESVIEAIGLRFEEMWKVEIGYMQDDKIDKILLVNVEGDESYLKLCNAPKNSLTIIHFWSIHNKCFDTELAFIEMRNLIDEKLKDSGFSIELIMISGDSEFSSFKEFVTHKNWNVFIKQYINSNIFDDLCISALPSVVIIKSSGELLFFGTAYSIDLLASILNYLKDQNSPFKPSLPQLLKEDYTWWSEYSDQVKSELVQEVNFIIADAGLNEVQFSIITQSTISKLDITKVIIPVLTGAYEADQLGVINEIVKDIEGSLGFKKIIVEATVKHTLSQQESLSYESLNSNPN